VLLLLLLLLLLLFHMLLPAAGVTCVAESADWAAKAPGSPMCNDTIYVMIYDAAHVLDGDGIENYVQQDGVSRCIYFIRMEDFVYW
jgi:hypothetical protein